MELWFLAAVGAAILAGISNHQFKVAAHHNYDAELFSFYGGIISIVVIGGLWALFPEPFIGGWFTALVFVGGLLVGLNNIAKVNALRFIDATIYYPLYKLLAPLFAIGAGVFILSESFSVGEWVGMLLGLFVPLLLISKTENTRQNNLLAGIMLVVVTGVFSATAAILFKIAVDNYMTTLNVLFIASTGLTLGTVITILRKTGWRGLRVRMKTATSKALLLSAVVRSILISASFGLVLYAFANGGSLALVQTIQSLYILIPIVLAVIFYNEHWNAQKVIAIVVSVAALALLG